MRRGLVALLALCWVLLAAAEPARTLAVGGEKRVALVIGNGAYPGAPLRNPVNDARDMAAALRRLGFEVIEKTDATQKEMNRAIVQFGARLGGGTVALFYYAGHGMQVKGRNYLIPVDAQIDAEAAVRVETVDVDGVLDQLSASALNVVILDACRNNPFERRFRGGGGGLAQMDAPKGTLIAYATAPGRVASDGDGRNGLYTQELLKLMQTPGLPLEGVFKKVRANVARATADNQVPWEASSLTGDFYFKAAASAPAASAPPPPVASPPDTAVELAYWDGVKESRLAEAYGAYLERYPAGRFADLARLRLRELSAASPAMAPAPAPAASPRQAAWDFLEGIWELQVPDNRAQFIVHWNPDSGQYEGVLWRQGQVSAYVGFSLSELVWKGRPTADPKRLRESQAVRTGQNGVSIGLQWLEGEMHLERSSANEVVSSFSRWRRVQ